ncbi:MAG: hypothetical protein OCC45_15510 [Desulfotalea sp.]
MQPLIHARLVATFTQSLTNFQEVTNNRPVYSSIGAVIIDSILQAGLNYKNIVAPRVEHFLENFSHIRSTSQFLKCLQLHGAEKVFRWTHTEKINRLIQLTKFLISKNIETIKCLRTEINKNEICTELLNLRGIGKKTVDYIAMLVGIPSIPIDRHLRAFINAAGVELSDYDQYRKVAEFTADLLKIPRSNFDYSVWSYVSGGKL